MPVEQTDHQYSRRTFIQTATTAAAATLLTQRVVNAASPDENILCGVIGVGGRGTQVMEAAYQVPGVRVAALCDIRPARLHAAAKKISPDQPELFEDYRHLLEMKELDAVFVETPCYLHKEMAIAVMDSGKHCYSEKPMAITLRDVNAVYAKAKDAKTIYQIGTQLRYASPWKTSIEEIHNKRIGRPIMIRAHRHNMYDLPHDRPWFFDRKLSGDVILEQAVHEFDLFNQIFRDIPRRASGFGGQSMRFEPPGRNIRDHFSLSLDYGDNKEVGYTHSWLACPSVPCDGRRELIYGPLGQLDMEEGKIYLRDAKEGEPPLLVSPEPSGDSTMLAVTDFFRCIREGDQPLAGYEDARNAALVGLLGRKVLDEGRTVSMDELLAEG